MPEALVVHRSRTGFARRYAQWIAEELHCPSVPLETVSPEALAAADLVIFGGGVHLGRIRGFPRFRKLIKRAGLHGEPGRIIVWANGGTPCHPDRDWKPAAGSFTATELARGDFDYFYLEGGVRWEGLRGMDRALLKIFARRVQRHRHRGPWAEFVADHIKDGYDNCSRDQIAPLVMRAREILASAH